MNNDTTFHALLEEAQFTKEMLGAGATQIRKAGYATKGIYFQAFTSLSTGLERLGKICLLLDYYIRNNGGFPPEKYFRKEIGHNIEKIYARSIDASVEHNVKFSFLSALDDEMHKKILNILSQFALGERYSNIDALLNSSSSIDPITRWFEEVDLPLFAKHVTDQKKQKITNNAQIIDQLIGSMSLVHHSSETGSDITTVEEASMRTGIFEAVGPYRQRYVIQIIRFWAELCRDLQYIAMGMGKQDIPFMNEIFAPFCNSDAYVRTRKTWDTV